MKNVTSLECGGHRANITKTKSEETNQGVTDTIIQSVISQW